jgi:hypothetical protein
MPNCKKGRKATTKWLAGQRWLETTGRGHFQAGYSRCSRKMERAIGANAPYFVRR